MSWDAAERPARPEPITIACFLVDAGLDMVEMRCFSIMDVIAARREKSSIFKSLFLFMVDFLKRVLGVYVLSYLA